MAPNPLFSLAKRKVLLIGIGGGGDALSAMPLYFELRRLGAEPLLAGLTWKRRPHDPESRPRALEEFNNVTVINQCVGLAAPQTALKEGIRHIEADLSAALKGAPVGMIDISQGAARVRESLRDFMLRCKIDAVIGVDVGGDALCFGDEAEIGSPLCDQVMLCVLAGLPGKLLGVIGLGADGELPFAKFGERFFSLRSQGAFLGALPVRMEDLPVLEEFAGKAKTESSMHAVRIARLAGEERLEQMCCGLATDGEIDLLELCGGIEKVALRGGRRQGELSLFSACTLLFDLPAVFNSSLFSSLLDENKNIEELHSTFSARGYRTELSWRLEAG